MLEYTSNTASCCVYFKASKQTQPTVQAQATMFEDTSPMKKQLNLDGPMNFNGLSTPENLHTTSP